MTIGSLLATCYEEQNKLNEAETILKQYLKMNDDTNFTYSSHNYPDVFSCASQLAGIYLKQNNKFDQAIQLFELCLTEKKLLYGHNHYETFKSMNLLVQAFHSHNMKEKGDDLLGKYFAYRNKLPKKETTSIKKRNEEKKKDLDRKLRNEEIKEKIDTFENQQKNLGEVHKDTLDAMNQLATIYISYDKFDKAKTILLELFQRQCRIFGEQHKETIDTMDRLAIVSTNIKRDTETLKVLKMLYKLRENENPNRYNKDTEKTIEILSAVYTILKKNNQNDPMIIHTGTIIYEIKASSTPNLITETTLDAMKKLAEYCILKSMINSALSIYRTIITHKKINSSGNYDVEVFAIIEEMGKLLFLNRIFVGSEHCFKQLLKLRLDSFGQRNANTISTMMYLMKVYDEQENYSECIKLINAYDYTIDEKLKFEIKIALIEIKSYFANIYCKAGNYHDAKQCLQDCIEKFQKYHGDNWKFPEKKYPQILLIMYQLGKIQMVLKEYDEAEKYLKKSYSLRIIIGGARDNSSTTEESMKSLLNCYRTQGKEEQAEILLMHYEDAKTAALNKAAKKIAKKNAAQASHAAATSTKIAQISNPYPIDKQHERE